MNVFVVITGQRDLGIKHRPDQTTVELTCMARTPMARLPWMSRTRS